MMARKRVAVLRVVDGAGDQCFGESLNGGKRRAEFVGNIGHKIAPHALEFSQIGDVVQHDYRAGSFSRTHGGNRGCKKMLPQRPRDDFRFHARLARQARCRTASISSVWRTTSSSELPATGGTSKT